MLLSPRRADAAVVLDPANPTANFTIETANPVARTSALGTAQILEVNGVAPEPRVELVRSSQPSPLRPRTGPTVEFGCMNLEALATAEIVVFRVERVGAPVAGNLTFTRFRIRDTDSTDKLAFRADYQLGTGTNGIDPATEPVTIKMSVPGWEFYSQTLNGFTLRGAAPRRRWTLNDAERLRTGIEQLVIDEDPNNTGGIFLRDVATELADVHFGSVTAEITIGTGALADKLTGTAQLVEKDWGSGNWRFHREA